jgi:sarcosine oxidase, subunit gamma
MTRRTCAVTADALRHSPLDGVQLPDGLRELPFLAQVDLRADPDDEDGLAEVAEAIGFELPTEPNTVRGVGDHHALWLGPDEWLIVGPPGTEVDLVRILRSALGDRFGAVVDVSAARTTLELTGPHARAVLEFGCSLDLDPRAFPPGSCAQTLVARAQLILQHVDPAPTYRLYVRPSFAAYLAAWLIDSAEGLA